MNNEFTELVEHFRNEGTGEFNIDVDNQILSSWLRTDHGPINMVIQALGDTSSHLIFSARSIVSIPAESIKECLRLANMINWRLVMGNFEIDQGDGELTFRVTSCHCDASISPRQFKHAFNATMGEAVNHYSLFQKIIWKDLTAEEAISQSSLYENNGTLSNSDIPENYAEEAIRDLTNSLTDDEQKNTD